MYSARFYILYNDFLYFYVLKMEIVVYFFQGVDARKLRTLQTLKMNPTVKVHTTCFYYMYIYTVHVMALIKAFIFNLNISL